MVAWGSIERGQWLALLGTGDNASGAVPSMWERCWWTRGPCKGKQKIVRGWHYKWGNAKEGGWGKAAKHLCKEQGITSCETREIPILYKGKLNFTMRVVQHWNRLLREVVGSLSLENSQTQLGEGPEQSALTWKLTLFWTWGCSKWPAPGQPGWCSLQWPALFSKSPHFGAGVSLVLMCRWIQDLLTNDSRGLGHLSDLCYFLSISEMM